jgi:hypothetical protein
LGRDCKSNITKARRKPRIDGRICNSVIAFVLAQEALIPSRHGPINKLDFLIVARASRKGTFHVYCFENVTVVWGKARKDKL